MKTLRCAIAISITAVLISTSIAQVPGDGIPDVYELVEGGETCLTSIGEITRPAGTVFVDTDGNAMVAVLIEGSNIVANAPNNGNYLAGTTALLPDPNAEPPLFASLWAAAYIGGRNHYLRVDPLDTDGFAGVVGVHADDPFGIFPNLGLGTTDAIDGGGTLIGEDVVFHSFAMGEAQTFSTEDGTMGPVSACVPEPSSIYLALLATLVVAGRWAADNRTTRALGLTQTNAT